jgi:hypothetical protein
MPWKKKRKQRDSGTPLRPTRFNFKGCGCVSLLLLFLVLATVLLYSQWTFLQHRFVTYPRMADALAELEEKRRPAPRADGRTDLRGVFHSHSLLSHDSMGTPAEIVRGAKLAKIDFIFLTDHPATPPKDVPPELQGEHDGITLIPGVETSQGMIAWFFDTRTVDPKASLAAQITAVQAAGGVAGVCHPDEPRPWDHLPPFTAMEIYNLHADAKKTKWTMSYRVGEMFWSMPKYPMEVFYGLFHDPMGYVALWDHLTIGDEDHPGRRVVAIAGNDAHQNNGVRLVVSPQGGLVLTDTSPKVEPMMESTNWLARRFASGHAVGETVWRWDADLYERSFRFVNTHLLATGHSPSELRAALEAGHAYVAFDSLVTATGFDFSYRALDQRFLMGDEAPLSKQGVLSVDLPVSALISLKRNGVPVAQAHDTQLRYTAKEPGVYRVEVFLDYDGTALPWIYSNPIYLE